MGAKLNKWTPEEVALLHQEGLSDKDIAHKTNRTVAAVGVKRSSLNKGSKAKSKKAARMQQASSSKADAESLGKNNGVPPQGYLNLTVSGTTIIVQQGRTVRVNKDSVSID